MFTYIPTTCQIDGYTWDGRSSKKPWKTEFPEYSLSSKNILRANANSNIRKDLLRKACTFLLEEVPLERSRREPGSETLSHVCSFKLNVLPSGCQILFTVPRFPWMISFPFFFHWFLLRFFLWLGPHSLLVLFYHRFWSFRFIVLFHQFSVDTCSTLFLFFRSKCWSLIKGFQITECKTIKLKYLII